MTDSKRYIVVGAGWFGLRTVLSIEKSCPSAKITVLELNNKDYVDINITTPRLLVEPDFGNSVYQPLTKVWKNAELINIAEIKSVTSGKVVYMDKEGAEQTLEGDGIILATGAVQPSPFIKDVTGKSKEDRMAQLTSFRDAVKDSKGGVLVVGGGTTGVEMAAEIATDFPDVKVTLINKPDLLLRGVAKQKSMHNIVMKQLTKLKVTVITGDYIEGLREDYMGGETKIFETTKGEKVEADVVLICAGGHPNVDYAPADAKDEKTGGLIVNSAMLSKLGTDATKPVWAVGDCTQYNGRGVMADPQTAALTASIKHYDSKGTTEGGPEKYQHKMSETYPSLLSIGRKGGAMTLPFPNKRLGKALKAKDLGLKFIYSKEFKLKV